MADRARHFPLELSNLLFFLLYLKSYSLCLFLDFNAFSLSILVLIFQNVQLVVEAGNNVLLTLYLSFEISLQRSNAYVKCLFSSSQVFNLSLKSDKISFV